MAEIPIYRGEQIKQKNLPGVAVQAPDISQAAQLPFLQIAKTAENLQSVAFKKYESDLSFANQKLEQQLDFNNKKLKNQKDVENQLHKIDLDYNFQKYKIDEDLKVKSKELETEAKLQWETAAITLSRKNNVQAVMQDLYPKINELKYSLASSSNIQDKETFRSESKVIFDTILNNSNIDDKSKQIATSEFQEWIVREAIDVDHTINTNLLNVSNNTYEKEIEQLIYDYNFSNNPIKSQHALERLLGSHGIVYEMSTNGLIVQGSEGFKIDEIKNKLFGMESNLMIDGENANPQKWLDLLDQGYWKDRLNNNQITSFAIKADAEVTKINNNIITSLNSIVTKIRSELNSQETILEKVSRGNLPYLEDLKIQAEQLIDPNTNKPIDPSLSNDIQILIDMVDQVDQFKRFPEIQQEQTIADIENQQSTQEYISEADVKRLEIFKSIHANLKTQKKEDVLVLAQKNEVLGNNSKRNSVYPDDSLDSLNFYSDNNNVPPDEREMFDSIQKRIDQALYVQNYYGLEVPQFLTKSEALQFKNAFANADANDLLDLATMITRSFDNHAIDVFSQINKDAPAMAEIGGHVLNGNINFAMDIAQGHKRIQSANLVPNFKNNAAYGEIIVNSIGDSLVDNIASMDTKLAAIENVIINRALDEGWLSANFQELKSDPTMFIINNKDKIEKIVNESFGAKYNGDTLVSGGSAEWNGNRIILPSNFTRIREGDIYGTEFLEDDELGIVMENKMTDDLLIKAGGQGVLPVSSPYVDLENREEVTLNAANVFGQEGKAYYWDQIEPGKYLLALLDPTTEENPDYLHYPGTDDLFIFDLNKITTDLNFKQ